MNNGITDALILMAGYTVWIFVIYFLMNALTLKFLGTYLKVRTSMGRKVLVKISGMTSYYYKAGTITDGVLTYKTRDEKGAKVTKSHDVNKNYIGRTMGVGFVVVDEETNLVMKPDLDGAMGYDAVKQHNLYVRALQAPKLGKDDDKLIKILLIACLLAILVVGFLVFKQGEVLSLLQAKAIAGNVIAQGVPVEGLV